VTDCGPCSEVYARRRSAQGSSSTARVIPWSFMSRES
jgi:hypothetical protein